jgi:hypothetical protein
MTSGPSCFFLWKFGSKDLTEAEEPEPESIGRTMSAFNWSEGLRVTEYGIRLSVGTDLNEKRDEAPEQTVMRVLAFWV